MHSFASFSEETLDTLLHELKSLAQLSFRIALRMRSIFHPFLIQDLLSQWGESSNFGGLQDLCRGVDNMRQKSFLSYEDELRIK